MTPQQIIRRASLAGIDLTVVEGRLVARSQTCPLTVDLLSAMKEHKAAIIHVLTVWPLIDTIRTDTLSRCLPLTPDDLESAERVEAEELAANLIQNGGFGQFIIDLMYRWNDLTETERLQAAWCWETAIALLKQSLAA